MCACGFFYIFLQGTCIVLVMGKKLVNVIFYKHKAPTGNVTLKRIKRPPSPPNVALSEGKQ